MKPSHALSLISALLLTFLPSAFGVDEQPQTQKVIHLGGELQKPGPMILTNGMVVMDAIRSAGGFTPHASGKITVRSTDGKSTTLNRQDIEKEKTKDVKLQGGEQIHFPRRKF